MYNKKLICICIRFWKKESFQFVPKTADGEYRITQIIGERVPNSRGSVEEAARADCLRFRSRDNEKTLLKPGWAQGGTGGRYCTGNSRRGTGERACGGTCRRVGRSCTSPDFECPASVAVGASDQWRMTDMGVVALIWRRRAGPIEACRSGTSDTTPADRYSNRYAHK